MRTTELRKEICAIGKQLIEANNEFNNATGLYIDAIVYKILYLEATRDALLHDLKEENKNDRLRETWIQKQA